MHKRVEPKKENTSASKKKEGATFKPLWFILSFVALIAVLLMLTPASLPLMGKAALEILALAVIVGVTKAVSYP
ncbi:hypothetical protein DV952_13560, partial [Staphylococcus pseudintermedius]